MNINPEVLQRIDKGIEQMQGDMESFNKRLEELGSADEQLTARATALDEGLSDQKDAMSELEKSFTKERHPITQNGFGETDTLRNALPEDLRRHVPALAMSKGYQRLQKNAPPGSVLSDPLAYAGIAGWFQAQIKAAISMSKNNPKRAQEHTERAEKIAEALGGFHANAKAALQEDTDAEGGYLVPTITEAMIGWILKDASVVRASGPTVVQMSAKTHQLPTLGNDFSVEWLAEEGTISDSAPASPFSQGTLTAKKQAGLVTVSIELIQDNIVNLMDFVVEHLLNLVGRAEDIQALEGDGTVFSGLFSVSGTNSVAGGGDPVSMDELAKLIYGGEEQSTIDGGVIYCHPWFVRDAIQMITGTAGAVWLPYVNNLESRPTNLMGVPTFPTAGISRTRSTDDMTAYHGNPRYIVIGDRMGTTFDVNPWSETEFKSGQILLRLLRRVGILIWVPGYFTKLTAVQAVA